MTLGGEHSRPTVLQEAARRRKLQFGILFAAGGVLLVSAVALLTGGLGKASKTLIHYRVQRRDLPILVTERGNLESRYSVKIRCEVDDIEGDGIHGTPILWVVPNGTSVKKGDLLVELDSANHQERLDRQILNTERARAEQIKARVQYENQKTQNQTSLAEAQLKVELADLALKQFEDKDGGTFQIELQAVELQIQEAQAEKLIRETNLEGVVQLHKLGYRSEGELAQARLSALKAERMLASAISKKKELVEYQYHKTKMELEGALASARRSLEQVQRDNAAHLEQAKAAMEAADESMKKEQERLERYQENVRNCKMYSPEDGMVAYQISQSRWHRAEIRAGAAVWPNQTIMTLPSLTQMQVKTAVHESVLDQIKVGLPATIRLDAFQERSYRGSVHSVAVLPDQDSYMSSDTKMYETIVTIDEEVKQIKPGMTAVVEIHVDRLKDVLSVPLQAVVQIQEDTWCYVDAGGGRVERRTLALGRTNDKFIEIREGLQEGERVVLNPMAIVDETRTRESTISPDEGDESSGKPIPPLEGDRSSKKSAGNRPEKSSGSRPDVPAETN